MDLSNNSFTNIVFTKLNKKLVEISSIFESSQKEFCEFIDKLRVLDARDLNVQADVLNNFEELIDGTFDQLDLKNKEVKKFVEMLREQSSSAGIGCNQQDNHLTRDVSVNNTSVLNGFATPDSVIEENNSHNSTFAVNAGATQKNNSGSSTRATNSLHTTLSTASSVDGRLMIDESAISIVNSADKATTPSNKSSEPDRILSREENGVKKTTKRESTAEIVDSSRNDVGGVENSCDVDSRMSAGDVVEEAVNENAPKSPITSTSANTGNNRIDVENELRSSTRRKSAISNLEVCHPFTSTAAIPDNSVWAPNESTLGGEQVNLSSEEVEVLLLHEVPLECVVEVEPFNAQTLLSSCRSKQRTQKNADTARLSRVAADAEKLLNNFEISLDDDVDELIKEENFNSTWPKPSKSSKKGNESTMSERRTAKKSTLSKVEPSIGSDGDKRTLATSHRPIVIDEEDEDESIAEMLRRDEEATSVLSDEEMEEIKEIRKPVTRSRDQADMLLRKNVDLLSSSEGSDEEELNVTKSTRQTSKALITRKRKVCSSSSEAELLEDSDVDDGDSGEQLSEGSENSAVVELDSESEKRQRKRPIKRAVLKKDKKMEKKKRRVAVDSDEERSLLGSDIDNDEDGEDAGTSKKIFRGRKMISRSKLAKSTIDAEKAEKERRKRLQEKQKEFNGIEMMENDDSGEVQMFLSDQSMLAPKMKTLILDRDEKSNPPRPVEVHSSLVSLLKPHQAEGLVFMYNSLFESIERLDSEDSFGGILAHCMGLGKTFQVIAFLHTVLTHPTLSNTVRHVMIVGPKNVLTNWVKEFKKWLYDVDPDLDSIKVYNLSAYTKMDERKEVLREWSRSKKPSALIISYEMFRILTESDEDKPKPPKSRKPKKKSRREKQLDKMKVDFRKYLQDPGPDLIVCDEGHKLKSDETSIFKTMSKIRTSRRLCLTGTPMQNNLSEYYTMISFVKPGLLGTKHEFGNRFCNIINRGQTIDATPTEVRCMKRRCHVLYDFLNAVVHRRDYRVLVKTIPPKQEYVVYVRMTKRQCELYRGFLRKFVENGLLSTRKRLLPDYHIFSRIWTHPFALVLHERDVERQRLLNDDDEFVVSDEEEEEAMSSGNDDSDVIAENEPSSSNVVSRRSTRQNPLPANGAVGVQEEGEEPSGWYSDLNLVSKEDEYAFNLGNKLVLLQQVIKKCEEIGDKLLIFSQSLESLRIIRNMLTYLGSENLWFVDGHEPLRSEGEEWGWENNVDFLVIDGSVSTKSRDYIQDQFNDPLNLRARLMLISTLAGSLGTNLVTANRVVIFDACWNPSHDTQAMFRVYRYGQVKPVYIYRFIAQGTMEERIYKRQVTKESTARRVTEEAQIQRHFRGSDLYELYVFDPAMEDENDGNSQTTRLAPPKDRLLADIILSHGKSIVSYLQHDSLFDEVEDEKLTEAERKEAWEDYEREKTRPVAASSGYVDILNNRSTLPGHLVILENSAPALLAITAGGMNDTLYRTCFTLAGMSHDIAIRVLFIKRLLDRLMPLIPNDRRGGIHEFDSYFVNIIRDTNLKKEPVIQLLVRAVQVFQTTVSIVRDVPVCSQLITNFFKITPNLFVPLGN